MNDELDSHYLMRDWCSLVTRHLAKVKTVGPNPTSRSIAALAQLEERELGKFEVSRVRTPEAAPNASVVKMVDTTTSEVVALRAWEFKSPLWHQQDRTTGAGKL